MASFRGQDDIFSGSLVPKPWNRFGEACDVWLRLRYLLTQKAHKAWADGC